MAYTKNIENLKVGDKVRLTKKLESMSGHFHKGDLVEIDEIRGYGFKDEQGNRVIECGWDCCVAIVNVENLEYNNKKKTTGNLKIKTIRAVRTVRDLIDVLEEMNQSAVICNLEITNNEPYFSSFELCSELSNATYINVNGDENVGDIVTIF